MARLLVLNNGELSQEITSFSEILSRTDDGKVELHLSASITTEDVNSLNSELILKFAPYFEANSIKHISFTDGDGRVLSESSTYNKIETVGLQGDENQENAVITVDCLFVVE